MKENVWRVLVEVQSTQSENWGVLESRSLDTKCYFGDIGSPKYLCGRYIYVYRSELDSLELPEADIVVRYSDNEDEWIDIYEV